MGLALAAHWDLTSPHVLSFLRDEVGNLSRDVAWRDGVRAREFDPFDTKGFAWYKVSTHTLYLRYNGVAELTEMHDSSLCSVVRGLKLWIIDNVSAHRSCSDKTAVRKVFQLLPVDIGSLTLLPSPDGRTRTCTVERAVDVSRHNFAVVVDGALCDRALGPGDAGVGYEDVETAIEVLENLLDCGLDLFVVLHVDLVCSACTVPKSSACAWCR